MLDLVWGLGFLAVYYFISQTFEGASTAALGGAPSYFAFAAVGAVVGIVIDSVGSGISVKLREEQLTGTLEMLVVQPISSVDVCLGITGFPLLFGAFRAAFYLVVAGLWMKLDVATVSWPGVFVVFAGTGLALIPLGIASAAAVLVTKRGFSVVGVATFFLTLASGSVFPISALPDWLQALARASPLRFAFDGMRSALFVGSGWAWDALWLYLFGLIGIPLALLAFDRALGRTIRQASLTQY